MIAAQLLLPTGALQRRGELSTVPNGPEACIVRAPLAPRLAGGQPTDARLP